MRSAAAMTKNEIQILPSTDEHSLCLVMHGVISKDDFEEHFLKPLKERAASGQKYNLLLHYAEDFQGWDKDAAEMSFQSIIDYGGNARKIAYINAPDSKHMQIRLTRPLFGGEIEFFEEGELEKAIKWVKA